MRIVDSKGLSEDKADPWLVKDLHAELKAWGRPGGGENKLVIKSDGESPIVAVREALARKHGGIVSPEQPPKGEHASNGVIEESGKTVRDMAKVLKLQLETQLGRTLHMKEPIMHWLVRRAAMSLSRFQAGKDHNTANQRQTGKACNVEVVPFAENIWYRKSPDTGPKRPCNQHGKRVSGWGMPETPMIYW